jgi:hypothetical protein
MRDGLLRIDPSSRSIDTVLRNTDSLSAYVFPFWADGGRAATFTWMDLRSLSPRVLLTRLGDPRVDTLAEGFNGQVLPTGDLLWGGGNHIVYTAPVDVSGGRLSGGRQQLLSGVQMAPGFELMVSVSRQGDLVYALDSAVRARSHLVIVNRRTGERTTLPSPPGVRVFPDLRLSPDGGRLAVAGTRGTSHEIWIYQLESGQTEQFTVGGISSNMLWSPEGDRLTSCTLSPHTYGIAARPVDKRQPATLLARTPSCPRNWTPDGKTLFLELADTPSSPGFLVLTPPDTVEVRLGNPGEFGPAVSPDGRWLAYALNTSGSPDVWVRGFRTPGGPWKVSEGGGFDPVWSRDGRSLHFRADSTIMMVDVSADAVFRAAAPRRVTSASSSVGAVYGQSFDLFPDGERLVLFESGNGASVEHLIFETNLLRRSRKP